jgi:hypothetical protein
MTIETSNLLKPDYKGFVLHMKEYDKVGAPVGVSDLIRISRLYNTPIPKRKTNEDGSWDWDWTGTDMEDTNLKK